MLDQARCSDISRSLDEALLGTASRVRSWLLIEQPGPWGRDAVVQDGLGEDLGRRLKQHASPHGIRILLIRRPDGSHSSPTQSYLCFSGLDDRWILRLRIASPADLLDVDLSPVSAGERPLQGEEHEQPVYLVCTHSEHDACCGSRGRPVARELAGVRREDTWESSHVGGDRFAANLVTLPHGLYFGRIRDPNRIVQSCENGQIDLDHYRGRACYEPVVQAAEVILRRRYGIRGIDDVAPEERTDHGGGESSISFLTASGERLQVGIRTLRGEKRRLTCEARNPGRPRVFIPMD